MEGGVPGRPPVHQVNKAHQLSRIFHVSTGAPFPLHFLIASLSEGRLNAAENVGVGLQRGTLWE